MLSTCSYYTEWLQVSFGKRGYTLWASYLPLDSIIIIIIITAQWQHPTCRKMRYRQKVLQRPRLRERRPSTVRSPLVTCLFYPVAVDSWSLVRRGSRPHCRNWQKTHALHSRLAGNYVCVPMYFCGNSAFQRSVPCQHVHSLRVPIVTIPDIHFCIY